MAAKKPRWESKFLKALAEEPNVSLACRIAHVSRETVYDRKRSDEEFESRWASSLDQAVEGLEEEARKRAKAGSDTLLIFLLKAHRPEIYREHLTVDIDITREVADTLGELAALQKAALSSPTEIGSPSGEGPAAGNGDTAGPTGGSQTA